MCIRDRYYLTNRISIATELALVINRTYSKNDSNDFVFLDPIFNLEREVNMINDFNLSIPKVIQINFHF